MNNNNMMPATAPQQANMHPQIRTAEPQYPQQTGMCFNMPSPVEMDHLLGFCKVMASSPFYQKMGPGGIMAIYLTAKEYNLPFMACMNGGLHTFDGKVTFSAIMINSMIINAGHKADLLHIDDTRCVIRFTRGDRRNDQNYRPLDYEYTIEMAQRAGYLKKNNWQTSLRDMLYNRCLTGGGRKHTPEVFIGVLSPGELVGDDSDQYIQPILPPEVAVAIASAPKQIVEEKKVEEDKPKVYLPEPGYDDFVGANMLFMHADGSCGSRKMEYIKATCDKMNWDQTRMINYAMANTETFESSFLKWQEKTYPQATSMDELAMEESDELA